jgi:hypothetical protein
MEDKFGEGSVNWNEQTKTASVKTGNHVYEFKVGEKSYKKTDSYLSYTSTINSPEEIVKIVDGNMIIDSDIVYRIMGVKVDVVKYEFVCPDAKPESKNTPTRKADEVNVYTDEDLKFLDSPVFNGSGLEEEQKISILNYLKTHDGKITEDFLLEIGISKGPENTSFWSKLLRTNGFTMEEKISFIETEYRMSRLGSSFFEMDESCKLQV